MSHPSAERVRELFDYNQETGALTWRKSAGRRKAGDIAGSMHVHGYMVIGVDGKDYGAHRIVWLYVTGEWPRLVDHINGIRDDNRFANLRHADKAANARNRAIDSGRNKLLGAYAMPDGRFKSLIVVDGRHVHLGLFETEQAAHEAYMGIRRELDEAERLARADVVQRHRKYKVGEPLTIMEEVIAQRAA